MLRVQPAASAATVVLLARLKISPQQTHALCLSCPAPTRESPERRTDAPDHPPPSRSTLCQKLSALVSDSLLRRLGRTRGRSDRLHSASSAQSSIWPATAAAVQPLKLSPAVIVTADGPTAFFLPPCCLPFAQHFFARRERSPLLPFARFHSVFGEQALSKAAVCQLAYQRPSALPRAISGKAAQPRASPPSHTLRAAPFRVHLARSPREATEPTATARLYQFGHSQVPSSRTAQRVHITSLYPCSRRPLAPYL